MKFIDKIGNWIRLAIEIIFLQPYRLFQLIGSKCENENNVELFESIGVLLTSLWATFFIFAIVMFLIVCIAVLL